MVLRYYVCLSPFCEDNDGGQRAFIKKEKAEEHKRNFGHGYREVNKTRKVSSLYYKGKGRYGKLSR